MYVVKKKRTSKCTDGSSIYEYTLSDPVDKPFIAILETLGKIEKRELGGLLMFTFRKEDWFTLKGMSDDFIFYTTFQSSDSKFAEEFIETLLTTYNRQKSSE
jgi:hypothetical protein